MKRALPLVGLVLLLAACGSSQSSRPTVSGVNVAYVRRHSAELRALALLKRIPLPPGARAFRGKLRPSDYLGRPGLGVSVVSMTADRLSLWTVRGSGRAVMAFEKRHMVAGLRDAGGGASPGGYASDEFFGPHAESGPVGRIVSVSVEPHDGKTLLRLDAGVSWIYPRSPREVVPNGVRSVDVRDGKIRRHVTDSAAVARMVRWFDALNVVQPGPTVGGCMIDIATRVNLVFRSAAGAPLASAVVPSAYSNNCDPIEFTIGGKREPGLIDARFGTQTFAARLARLLGVTFPTR